MDAFIPGQLSRNGYRGGAIILEEIFLGKLSRELALITSRNIATQWLFNRDLNRGYLDYMYSLPFSGSKFLSNLSWQFRIGKFFLYT